MTLQSIAITDAMLEDFAHKRELSPQQQVRLAAFIAKMGVNHNLTHKPVGVKEFILSPSYLNTAKETVYPKVMQALVEMNSGQYTEIVHTGGIGCLSCDTEYLSPTGWVRMDQYEGGLIGQWRNGFLEWVHPSDYLVQPADSLWRFKTKYGIDQMVSDEHRMLYRAPKSGQLRVKTGAELATLHNRSVKGFNGRFLTTFKVAGETLDPALLRVQVMVCADGWLRNRQTRQCHVRVKKLRKQERCRELLQAAGIAFREAVHPEGYLTFFFKAPWGTKLLSDFCWGLSSESLQVIADECLHWDGNKRNYFTTVRAEADFMSYAGSAAGYRTVVDYDARALAPHWVVRFNPNQETTLQGVPKTPAVQVQTEDGKKYCFTVPSGFFITRHGGRVVVTGNSAKPATA